MTHGDRAGQQARPLTRAQMQQRTREDVLNAAEELFLRRGYRETTVAQIAAAAGRTQGAIYANFDSKENLCLEVLQNRVLSILGDVVAKLGTAGSDIEKIIGALLNSWRVLSQDVGLTALAAEYVLATRGDPDQQAALTGQIKVLRALIGVAVATSLPVDVPTDRVDRVIMAVLATLSGLAFGLSAGVVTASEASDVLEDTLRVWFGSLDAGAAEG